MDTRGGGQAADDKRVVKEEDYMSDGEGALGQDHDMPMPQQPQQQPEHQQAAQQQQQQPFGQQQHQQQQQAAPHQQGYQDRSRASTPGRHSASLVRLSSCSVDKLVVCWNM